MHTLQNATTYQLALVVDTLLAERHLLQVHASLASHMGGAGNPVQNWLEARRDETDASLVDVYRLASIASVVGSLDDKEDFTRIHGRARDIIREQGDLIDIEDLIANHREASAMDPETEEAAKALAEAEDALFAFRPATAEQARARAAYFLEGGFVDLSCWDTEDLRTFLRSMV